MKMAIQLGAQTGDTAMNNTPENAEDLDGERVFTPQETVLIESSRNEEAAYLHAVDGRVRPFRGSGSPSTSDSDFIGAKPASRKNGEDESQGKILYVAAD